MRSPTVELRVLRRYLSELETAYLAPHLSSRSLGPPGRRERLDVAAYVVLSHGALEAFLEFLSRWVLDKVESSWIHRKRALRGTASLLLHVPDGLPKEDGMRTVFDTIRVALAGAKTKVSTRIHENHGMTIKHVRGLLIPLGVDVPADPTLAASVGLLVSMRHEWAHASGFGGKVVRSAVEIKQTGEDCLRFAEDLVKEARTACA